MMSLTDVIDDSNALSRDEKSRSIKEKLTDLLSRIGTILLQNGDRIPMP